jgi:hypothetical protein
MRKKSKAMLIGSVLGTLLLGPGTGTLVGAAWGAQKHDEEVRKAQQKPGDDDDEHDPYDHRQA